MASGPLLDREFLEIRAKVLEVAACLDRLDRAPGTVEHDPRMVFGISSECLSDPESTVPRRLPGVSRSFPYRG